MYEMFTGQLAFKAETPVALAIKQIMERPTPPRELEPTLPPGVEAVISRCLEKDPAKRFQSVVELEAALLEETPEQPSTVRGLPRPETQAPLPPTPATTVSTQPARLLRPTALAVLGLLIIVAFFAGRHFWPSRPARSTPQVPTAGTKPSEPASREPAPREEVRTSRPPTSPGPPTYSPKPAVYHSTGETTQGWWNGAGGTACCGCSIKHYGVLPARLEPGYIRTVTFYLTGSRKNSYYSTVREGPTTLRFILGDRQVAADSRKALAAETGAPSLPWVIQFEFDSPAYARPGMRWELLDGDENIYSAVLLHQSNIPSKHNTEFALEGTADQDGCQYTFKRTVWYSAKFEYQ
jgi:serine/threonine protein kinase